MIPLTFVGCSQALLYNLYKNVDTGFKNIYIKKKNIYIYINGRFGCCYNLLQLKNVNENGVQDVTYRVA